MGSGDPLVHDGLISRWDYWKGWLRLAPRLPRIRKIRKKIAAVAVENRESWGSMIEENAARFPDRPFVKSEDGTLTYREYNEAVNRLANYFLGLGLKRGDVAVIMMENRPELLVAYSAMAKIGAVNSMINTNLRQDSLVHCVNLNPGRVFIVGEEVCEAFDAVRADLNLENSLGVFFVPDHCELEAPAGYTNLSEAVKNCSAANPPSTAEVKPGDDLAYVFTSGTTGGMPKAAVSTHGRMVASRYYNGYIILDVKPTDTLYIPLPFFHTNALSLSWPAILANGAAVAIRRKFSVSQFWDDVRKYDATMWCYIGELCRYLMNKPPRPDDRQNPLEKIIGNGLRPDIWREFKSRFGISKVYEIYGAAESNIYFVNVLNLDCTVGICNRPYAIVKFDPDEELPLRDENGFMRPIGVGETGLLLGEISEDNPFKGYTSRAATESKILRDVFVKGDAYYNTGDLMRDIGFKHARFVDRLGDTFRWKGENVSTAEVEKATHTFSQVAMCTAYGVVMPGGDGRIGMVAVIPEEGFSDFDFKGLAEHLQKALPSYAVPRFLRLGRDFEYTPTHKIKKTGLKKEGFDLDVIDDPIYVLLPGDSEYRPLTPEIRQNIIGGHYKF